ncbi:hypothetical protein RIF29_03801 [Crotalaria pallida]|uniref:Uncharacterized protein n=1 Tax=Crotalaria pallida TaxID=3830 RepID=A0AAN9P8V3_CROPI
MAIRGVRNSGSRKRKRVADDEGPKPKLILNERVEVICCSCIWNGESFLFAKVVIFTPDDDQLLLLSYLVVRCEEEGFLGSWHPGIVIRLEKLKRYVRYDNILDDDGVNYVVDVVNVSDALDDDDSSSSDIYTRGWIRPPPPPIQFEGCELQFGLCVDAKHEEAWWEGVIYDHCDGMEERSVFFPDLGDEMTFGIHQLRITQDWDEVTGVWERRGNWVFLELIEEFHRESLVTVSAKQIWYDIRMKQEFNIIREWTLNVKFLWKNLVMKVISYYLTLTLEEVLPRLELPRALKETPGLVSVEPTANVDLNREVDQATSLVVGNSSGQFCGNTNFNCDASPDNAFGSDLGKTDNPMKKGDSSNLLDTVQNCKKCDMHPLLNREPDMHLMADSNMHFEKETLVQEEPIPPVQVVLPELHKEISCCNAGEVVSSTCAEKNVEHGCSSHALTDRVGGYSRKRKIENWKRLILSEVKFCPDAVKEYAAIVYYKARVHWREKVLKHLAYLGWEIEWRARQDDYKRYRYKSPDKKDQKIYFSLLQICKDLQTDSMLSRSDQCLKHSTADSHLSHVLHNQSERVQDKDIVPLVDQCLKYSTADGHLSHVLHNQSKRVQDKDIVPLVDQAPAEFADEPEFFPQAVVEYYSRSSEMDMANKRKLILKARKHLLAEGWILTYPPPHKKRMGMLYRSPENRTFRSLYTACSFYINESKRKGSPLMVLRSSKKVQHVTAPCVSYHKPQNVLSWLIDSNMVLPRSKVYYLEKGRHQALAEGRISRDGIKCNCCQTVYTLVGFEKHSSSSRSCRPAASIFLEDGRSLLDCQIQIMQDHMTRKSKEKRCDDFCQGENDSICSVCRYGGELVLCDLCPSSFHKSCLGLEDIPDGNWFCPSCRCGMCGQSKIDGAEDGHFLTCIQCEHKYHVRCLRNRSVCKSGRDLENCFCGKDCEKIYEGLHKLLGEPVSVGAEHLTWTLMKINTSESWDLGSTENDSLAENYSKLNVALSVMHECFEPLKEPFSSGDLMEDVIFSRWSKLNRLNFKGFYTVLLERNEEIISVATIRVHGRKVAEVPLVGTRLQYRRHGMCRTLMNELEKKLMQLGVERLVLPAAPSVLETWTGSFGFAKMTNLERSEFLDYTFLDFQGTTMCQKLLMKVQSPDSVLSIESQQKPRGVNSGSYVINFDKSSPVSEVCQDEEIVKRGMLNLQIGDTCAGNNNELGSDTCDLVTMVKQPSHEEQQQCQTGTSPHWSLAQQADRFNGSLKFYTRKKVRKVHE